MSTLSLSSQEPSSTELQAANQARAMLYRWFADLFAHELTDSILTDWPKQYENNHQVFVALGLESPSTRLKKAIAQLQNFPPQERSLELAADFAQLFLLSGKQSAPPYASFYLDSDNMLCAEPAQQMRRFLASRHLGLHPDFREPDDHLSVYLHVISLWIKQALDSEANTEKDGEVKEQACFAELQQQTEFLEEGVLSWLPVFNKRCQQIKGKTDVYPALVELLTQFVIADKEAIRELAD